jgi:hypothetical protein
MELPAMQLSQQAPEFAEDFGAFFVEAFYFVEDLGWCSVIDLLNHVWVFDGQVECAGVDLCDI